MLPAWRSRTNLFPAICKMAQTPPTKTPSCHLQPFQSLLISSSLLSPPLRPPSHANWKKTKTKKKDKQKKKEEEEERGHKVEGDGGRERREPGKVGGDGEDGIGGGSYLGADRWSEGGGAAWGGGGGGGFWRVRAGGLQQSRCRLQPTIARKQSPPAAPQQSGWAPRRPRRSRPPPTPRQRLPALLLRGAKNEMQLRGRGAQLEGFEFTRSCILSTHSLMSSPASVLNS